MASYETKKCSKCNKVCMHRIEKVKKGDDWYEKVVCGGCGYSFERKDPHPHKR